MKGSSLVFRDTGLVSTRLVRYDEGGEAHLAQGCRRKLLELSRRGSRELDGERVDED